MKVFLIEAQDSMKIVVPRMYVNICIADHCFSDAIIIVWKFVKPFLAGIYRTLQVDFIYEV